MPATFLECGAFQKGSRHLSELTSEAAHPTIVNMVKILSILVMLISSRAFAIENGKWYAGVSYYTQNSLSKTTKSADGSKSFLGQTYYPLGVSYAVAAGSDSAFVPTFEYTLLPRTSKDGGTKATLMMLTLPYTEKFLESWDWSVGLTTIYYNLKGKGGTKQLNNGTGTATFALPGRSVSTINFATHLAVGYNYEDFRFQLGTNILALLSKERRAIDLFLTLQYKLGGM